VFNGRVYLIASRDADFVADLKELLEGRGGTVYVATSQWEADRLAGEIDVEMVVWDPAFRVAAQ
jgi:L-lactate utilization protein LutB